MISDTERREVAARLRKVRGLTEFAEVLGFDWTDDSDWGWTDVSNIVADFIEPIEPKVKCVAEVKIDDGQLEKLVHDAAVELTGIDRDVLLALADEMDDEAEYMNSLEYNYDFLMGYARRIRDALGVEP